MERYFLGSNTGKGFFGYFKEETENKKTVFLLKGGPGTGKSSLIKRLAKICEDTGYDYEIWYCSGDPSSADGIYVKELDLAVADATAPHTLDPSRVGIKEFVIDLSKGLNRALLKANADIVDELLNDKKNSFSRAYQHLKCALCHYDNAFALMEKGYDNSRMLRYCNNILSSSSSARETLGHKKYNVRNLFSTTISPDGQKEYFDHLRGKEIFFVHGNEQAVAAFLNGIRLLSDEGTFLHNPLSPERLQGVIVGGRAYVSRLGDMPQDSVSETIELTVLEGAYDRSGADEELMYCAQCVARAEAELNKAAAFHKETEKYYIAAMDFDVCAKAQGQILSYFQ
jgi:hypothetical protein